MDYPVLRRFRDRLTGVSYRPGSVFATDDAARGGELVKGKYVAPAKKSRAKAAKKADDSVPVVDETAPEAVPEPEKAPETAPEVPSEG
jgi:hypothetical protein